MRRLFVTLIGLFVVSAAWAAVDMLHYRLRDLASTGEVDLRDYLGSIPLLMFFEPNCEYCIRQSRILNELADTCPGFQPIAIGTNGSRRDLQAEMRRMRARFPVTQISADLAADIGEVVGTPLMLIGDGEGNMITWLQGVQSTDTLRELIDRIDPAACARLD